MKRNIYCHQEPSIKTTSSQIIGQHLFEHSVPKNYTKFVPKSFKNIREEDSFLFPFFQSDSYLSSTDEAYFQLDSARQKGDYQLDSMHKTKVKECKKKTGNNFDIWDMVETCALQHMTPNKQGEQSKPKKVRKLSFISKTKEKDSSLQILGPDHLNLGDALREFAISKIPKKPSDSDFILEKNLVMELKEHVTKLESLVITMAEQLSKYCLNLRNQYNELYISGMIESDESQKIQIMMKKIQQLIANQKQNADPIHKKIEETIEKYQGNQITKKETNYATEDGMNLKILIPKHDANPNKEAIFGDENYENKRAEKMHKLKKLPQFFKESNRVPFTSKSQASKAQSNIFDEEKEQMAFSFDNKLYSQHRQNQNRRSINFSNRSRQMSEEASSKIHGFQNALKSIKSLIQKT